MFLRFLFISVCLLGFARIIEQAGSNHRFILHEHSQNSVLSMQMSNNRQGTIAVSHVLTDSFTKFERLAEPQESSAEWDKTIRRSGVFYDIRKTKPASCGKLINHIQNSTFHFTPITVIRI